MKIITSKFRKLYILKCCLGYLLSISCIISCLNFYRNNYDSNKSTIATIVLVAILFMTILATIELLTPFKIIVKPKMLEIHSYFPLRKREVKYSEIKKIERRKIIYQGKYGKISDGYHVSDITLYDNSILKISPDKFENYGELIQNIKENMT